MQAMGSRGATASEVGRRLGISKQAAGKTIERLEALGYAQRAGDSADRRRKLTGLTPRGVAALTLSRRYSATSGTAGRAPSAKTGSRTWRPAAGDGAWRDIPAGRARLVRRVLASAV